MANRGGTNIVDGSWGVQINKPRGLPGLYDTFNRISKITEHPKRKRLIRRRNETQEKKQTLCDHRSKKYYQI